MESFRNQYDLRKGKITLYQRTSQGSKYQSDNWNARINIHGQKAIRRSLRTPNQEEAEVRAEDLYQELLHKSKQGLSLQTKRFGLVCEDYLRHFTEQVERDSHLPKLEQTHTANMLKQKKEKITRYIIPILGDKNLDDITDLDIEDYVQQRKVFFISGPGSEADEIRYIRHGKKITRPKQEAKIPAYNTINKDLTTLRQVFEYARLKRWIDSKQIPVIKNLSKPKNYVDKKPDISTTEYKSLLKTLEWKIKKQTNPKHKRSHTLLHYYILILSNTGMRVTEAKNLRFSDCKPFTDKGEKHIELFVQGKGKSRHMVPLQRTADYLEQLKAFHKANAEQFDWQYSDDMKVFSSDKGEPVGSFSRALDNILNECGILYDKDRRKRSAGAFRKFYITMRLTQGGVNPFDLAKNCGTSLEVIQKYYEDLQPIHIANDLTKLSRD